MDAAILNAGLELAMAWGPEWLQPIPDRLSRSFPDLGRADLDAYDQVCREAMRAGHDAVLAHWNAAKGDQGQAFATFAAALRDRYPWVSDAGLSRLFSQGCYYAWRNAGLVGL